MQSWFTSSMTNHMDWLIVQSLLSWHWSPSRLSIRSPNGKQIENWKKKNSNWKKILIDYLTQCITSVKKNMWTENVPCSKSSSCALILNGVMFSFVLSSYKNNNVFAIVHSLADTKVSAKFPKCNLYWSFTKSRRKLECRGIILPRMSCC